MKKNTQPKSGYAKFAALSDAGKERQWQELNDPASTATFAPMSDSARDTWHKARRKTRARKDSASAVLTVAMDSKLLARANQYARRRRTSTAALVSRGLEAVLTGAA